MDTFYYNLLLMVYTNALLCIYVFKWLIFWMVCEWQPALSDVLDNLNSLEYFGQRPWKQGYQGQWNYWLSLLFLDLSCNLFCSHCLQDLTADIITDVFTVFVCTADQSMFLFW